MRSSGSSSAKATNPSLVTSSITPPRKVFALTGRSRPLDLREHAVRADIADVRLAEYVFAPHYAAPLPRIILGDTMLRETRDPSSGTMGTLATGEPFELLDVTGGAAWGVAPLLGLVGYVDAALLGPEAEA